MLTEEQLDLVHEHAMRILEEVGLDILEEGARRRLAEAGQQVDGVRVRFDRGFVMEQVAKAPEVFSLRARNPARSVEIGLGRRTHWMPVGGPAFASDLDEGRRSGRIADHDALVKLAQVAPELSILNGGTVEPQDLDHRTRHMDADYSVIRWSDKPYMTYGANGRKTLDGIELAAIVHGGRASIEAEPVLMTVVNSISPLVWDERMLEVITVSAQANQPIVMTPFLLAGSTAPVPIAGGLAQQVAEALSGVAIAQLVRPGVACMYGSFFTPVDMRTGSPAFGMPQAVLGILAGAQIARRYGLPYRGGGGLASGNSLDAQSTAETAMSLWATALACTDVVLHAAGWLEGGLTASFEKLAFDLDLLRFLEAIRRGIGFTDEELAFDAVKQTGPAGLFLESPHTMAPFREWLTMSPQFPTPDFATWEAMGATRTEQLANQEWKRLLAAYEDPGLDEAVDEELRSYIERRRAEPPDEED